MPLIPGHHFTPDRLGRLTCPCGRRWVDIAGAGPSDVGRPDIAHVGTLTQAEVVE